MRLKHQQKSRPVDPVEGLRITDNTGTAVMSVVYRTLRYVVNRFWLIVLIYLFSLLLAASLFALAEQQTLVEGLWWAVVTALTIGYGDLTPATTFGRIIGIVFGHFWIFGIVPMIVANIITHLLYDEHQFTHDEQEWTISSLQQIAKRLDAKLPEPPKLDD
jgi:voltage-gated potassium channel